MSTVYDVNKGINASIEFKGFKAQYITYLAVAMIAILLLFVIVYKLFSSIYVALGVIVPLGGSLIAIIQRLNKKYGENGLKKKMAARHLPKAIVSATRKVFIDLKALENEK